MPPLRVLDLFSGAGGAALGAHRAGLEHAACVELDTDACATLRAAGFPTLHCDVRQLSALDTLGPVDVVWGSPPCQPFSAAQTWGKRGAADVERNGWPWYLDVVRELKPRWCVAENVKRSLQYIWEHVLPALKELYPHVSAYLLNAADYGVPQVRNRVIVVAGPRVWTPPPKVGSHTSMREAIPSLLTDATLRSYPIGTGRAGSEPWRLNQPSPTVTTTEVKGTRASSSSGWTFNGGPDRASDAAFLAVGRRRLTIKECAALQGFPADYPFQGSSESRYRQLGNAVPPALAEAVLRRVAEVDRSR